MHQNSKEVTYQINRTSMESFCGQDIIVHAKVVLFNKIDYQALAKPANLKGRTDSIRVL